MRVGNTRFHKRQAMRMSNLDDSTKAAENQVIYLCKSFVTSMTNIVLVHHYYQLPSARI